MTDLQRALAILDEMIAEVTREHLAACQRANDEYAAYENSVRWHQLHEIAHGKLGRLDILKQARSRLSALATTTNGEQG